MKPITYSAAILAFGGFLLIAMGLYFVFLRPPILPEDLRYMGSTLQIERQSIPGLLNWLQKVFWVMGGYIFSTGVLTVFISLTSFRARLPWAFSIVALTGISSIGLMVAVNFIIGSHFRWLLLIFALPCAIALTLYKFHK